MKFFFAGNQLQNFKCAQMITQVNDENNNNKKKTNKNKEEINKQTSQINK